MSQNNFPKRPWFIAPRRYNQLWGVIPIMIFFLLCYQGILCDIFIIGYWIVYSAYKSQKEWEYICKTELKNIYIKDNNKLKNNISINQYKNDIIKLCDDLNKLDAMMLDDNKCEEVVDMIENGTYEYMCKDVKEAYEFDVKIKHTQDFNKKWRGKHYISTTQFDISSQIANKYNLIMKKLYNSKEFYILPQNFREIVQNGDDLYKDKYSQ